jgi:hypothetical protein
VMRTRQAMITEPMLGRPASPSCRWWRPCWTRGEVAGV